MRRRHAPRPMDNEPADGAPPSGEIPTSSTHMSSSELDDATLDIPSGRPTPTPTSEDEAAATLAAGGAGGDASAIPVSRSQCKSSGFDRTRVWDLSINSAGRNCKLLPSHEVAQWITEITKLQPDINAWNFKHASQASKDRWFDAWRSHFKWDENQPGMDINTIRLLWNKKAKRRYDDMVSKARNRDDKPDWIQTEAWERWKAVWKTDEFKGISDKQKGNRAANPHLHTSGSRSHLMVRKDMCEELSRAPTPLELFIKTHKRKANGELVDSRSRDIEARAREIITQKSSQSDTPLAYQDQCVAYLEAVGGVGLGGAVFGLGSAAGEYLGDQITAPRREAPRVVELQRENVTLRAEVATLQETQVTQATQITAMAALLEATNKQLLDLNRAVEELKKQ